jgi:hypothetical protein
VECLLLELGAPDNPQLLVLFHDKFLVEWGKITFYPKPDCREKAQDAWSGFKLCDPEGAEITLAREGVPPAWSVHMDQSHLLLKK